MLFAALLYIYRVSQTTTVAPVTEEYIEDERPHILQDKLLPAYVLVLRIHGPFLFGATEKLSEATVDVGPSSTRSENSGRMACRSWL